MNAEDLKKLPHPPIPLRPDWGTRNDAESAEFWFPDFVYCSEARVVADFPLTYESLAPYVTTILDCAAPIEGAGLYVKLIEVKNGKVEVW